MAGLEFIQSPYMPEAGAAEIVPGEYYLCASADSKFALEIIKGEQLDKPWYSNRSYRVIGKADGRAEAFELTRRAVEDFVAGGYDITALGDYFAGGLSLESGEEFG